MRIILVTGLPATGKTTLARRLAARYGVPLLAKDVVKEWLMDAVGPIDATRSRQLSDMSFTLLFAQLAEHARAGADLILEGNFRAGQHEAALSAAGDASIAQVLCQIPEATRLQRIAMRAGDPSRHPGHGEARAAIDPSNDAFLDLPGLQLAHATDAADDGEKALLQRLDDWWN